MPPCAWGQNEVEPEARGEPEAGADGKRLTG